MKRACLFVSLLLMLSVTMLSRSGIANQGQDQKIFQAVKTLDTVAVRRYLQSGGNPNIRDFDGNTPLHWAVVAKARPLIRMLLDNKAGVNVGNRQGRTPLHSAAKFGLTTIADDLLQAGADPWIEDAEGQTPLEEAQAGRFAAVIGLLERAMASKPKPTDAVVLGKPTEWNQWRGPNRNGVALSSLPLAASWPPNGPRKVWEVGGLPQGGSGSPVVADGRVYLYVHDSHVTQLGYSKTRPYSSRDVIICRDANTGTGLWQKELPGEETMHEGSGTPCVVDGKVYVMAARTAYCLEADTGKIVWSFKPTAAKKLPVFEDNQEISSSFIVCDGVAVVCAGLTFGLDAKTGAVLWSAPDAGGYAMAMTSAVPWRKSGQTYMIYGGFGGLFCVNLRTGTIRWRTSGNKRGWDFASSPSIEKDTLVGCLGGELRGYNLSLQGPQLLWSARFLDPYSSPVLSQGLVYAVDKLTA